MAGIATTSERQDATAASFLESVDSVYFLLFPGWQKELRGNRWHFAVRWARYKPVVLVDPINRGGPAQSILEPRIPNSRILRLQSLDPPRLLAKRQVQLGQLLDDISTHGFRRPLLWSYNVNLIHLFSETAAAVRIHHATEAYFDLPDLQPDFLRRVRATVAVADVTIAVSAGVTEGLRRRVDGASVETVANGCDYRHYAAGKPDSALVEAARSYRRVAVYAGNVNSRLDFDLMNRTADRHPEMLLAIYGPVSKLDKAADASWRSLAGRPNVRAFGAVDPDRLRDLYAAADVGLIPYRQEPYLVENGLPLKAFEMLAAGLPVVSTLMKPLVGLADGIAVTSTAEEFLQAVETTSRARLTAREAADMAAVSAANDYDLKFQAMLSAIDRHLQAGPVTTRVDRMIEQLGDDWIASEVRFSAWLARPVGERILEWLITLVASLMPASMKRRLVRAEWRTAAHELRGS